MLSNSHDADEAAQEALVRAWRYRDTLRPGGPRTAWAASIARNAALDYSSRADRAEVQWPDTTQGAAGDDPNLGAALDQLTFNGLLAPFSDAEQDLLRLRYVDDLAYAEIARQLGAPVGTIKVRLHRLRSRLKTLIEERQKRA